jgi:hypothetical protein
MPTTIGGWLILCWKTTHRDAPTLKKHVNWVSAKPWNLLRVVDSAANTVFI